MTKTYNDGLEDAVRLVERLTEKSTDSRFSLLQLEKDILALKQPKAQQEATNDH